ncbi:MAG: hypothetical protein RLZZ387_3069 [Chloroflexota bacterium]
MAFQEPPATAGRALPTFSLDLEAVFEHMPVGLTVYDVSPDFRCVRHNARFLSMVGLALQERGSVVGVTLRELFDDRSYRAIRTIFEQVLASRSPYVTNEYAAVMTPGAAPRYYQWSLTPLIDERGAVSSLLAAGIELTDRYRAEAAVQASEAQLRLIADSLPVLISYVDREGRYRFNNRAYELWFGHSRDEITGRTMREVLGDEAYAVLRPHVEAALAGRAASFEAVAPYRDGGTRAIEATYVPDVATGEVRGFAVLVSDITARTRAAAAQQLLLETSALLESSLDYDTTLARVAHLVVPSHADFCIMYLVEEGAVQRVAVAHADPAKEVFLRQIEERYPLDLNGPGPVASVLRGGQPVRGEVDPELLTLLAKDNEHLALLQAIGSRSYVIGPMRAGNRTFGALMIGSAESKRRYDDDDLALVVELARRAAMAIENARLYRMAQEAIRLRDVFFSVAAHELKTPLTALFGHVQLLQRRTARDGTLGERDRRTVEVVVAQAQRMSAMVSGLLDIARLEQGQLSLERAPLDLRALVRRVVEEIQPTLDRHTLLLTLAPEPLVVDGDALRLEQVVHNLLSNAAKYSPMGGAVNVRVDRIGGRACVTVRDEGIGIPQAALPHLFQRFYRATNVSEQVFGGMGVGLYVVHEIVTLHGGSVTVESVEGRGSTFTICLPLLAEGLG